MGISALSQIVIVESLRENEMHTGRRLRDDLETQIAYHGHPLSVKYIATDCAVVFWTALANVLTEASTSGQRPCLHIECHANQDGIALADDSFISWEQLKPLLTAINQATALNLLVVMSACSGAYLAKLLHANDRAPVWGMIGPSKPARPTDLAAAFTAFYTTLISTLDGDAALAAMHEAAAQEYVFIPAAGFFKELWTHYLAEHGTDSAYWHRARKMRDKLKKDGLKRRPTAHDLQRILQLREADDFKRFFDRFFMVDLYPENAHRWSLRYEDVLHLRSKLKRNR